MVSPTLRGSARLPQLGRPSGLLVCSASVVPRSAGGRRHLASPPIRPLLAPSQTRYRNHRLLSTTADAALPPTLQGPQKGDHITIALSGGVDSSVTAALLARSSLYNLSAVFMRNWNELDESASFQPGSGGAMGCTWQRDWEDVQSVARHLGIPVKMVDLSREYWTQVFEPALGEWRDGVTPNPDVSCNREIKFGALMDRVLPRPGALEGATKAWLATGHYAHVAWTQLPDGRARPMLMRARDRTKDQTYYLSSVTEARLAHAHFPLAHLLKSEVRELAKKWELPTAERKESMGICFIGTRGANKSVSNADSFSAFLGGYIASPPGDIVDGDTGAVVGTHAGLHTLTVGQGARISGALSKYYVAKKDIPSNRIVVVQGKDHPMLLCTRLHVPSIDWIWNELPPELADPNVTGSVQLLAQVRHRQMETECTVTCRTSGGFTVEFNQPVLAVAPGQVLGLWLGQRCLGSAVIQTVETVHDDQHKQERPSALL